MQRNSPTDIITSIMKNLKKGRTTLTKLSKDIKINRITVSQYLTAFEESGLIRKIPQGREIILELKENPDSYFNLPIYQDDKKTMQTLYAIIRKTCQKIYNKEPGRTHVYKILYELNQEYELKLPVGWYQHGPCAVLIYNGNEVEQIKIEWESKIKEKVMEYCKMESIELQKMIYQKYDNKLYRFKEKLKSKDKPDVMELIKLVPQETIEITTDFARATLLLKWDSMLEIFFNYIWKYIAAVKFKETLRFYYGDEIEYYLQERIDERKIEAQTAINEKIMEYTDSKYSRDSLYQRWAKKKR